jgi:UPF0716 protein FxsA
VVIAGAMLLTPGFLTDAFGASLLLPPLRAFLYRKVRRQLEEQVRPAAASPGGRPAGDGRRRDSTPQEQTPPAVDVDFEDVEPGDMPEPRGSWKRGP